MRYRKTTRTAKEQRGYALVLVMFLLFLLVLSTFAVAPNVITEGRREKEAELVWRGKQYTRGIRLYYMKLHHYPTSLEDLTKDHIGVRFMRQPFKDPMNQADGSWRLIYVGPSGQLIGSLKHSTVNLTGNIPQGYSGSLATSGNSPFGGGLGQNSGSGSLFAPSSNNSSFGGNKSSFGSSFGSSSSFGSTGSSTSANSASGALGDQNAQDGGTGSMTDPKPLDSTANIIGGSIIGVGSAVNQRSIMVYDKARNYRLFEFVWDPATDALTGRTIGTIPPNQNNIGTPIGSPAGGNPNQAPMQNPFQNPPSNPPGSGENPPNNP